MEAIVRKVFKVRKVLKLVWTLGIFCVINFQLTAQTHLIDSLTARVSAEKDDTAKVTTMCFLGDKLCRAGKVDKAMQYGNQALELSKKLDDKFGEAIANRVVAQCYYAQLKYVDALHSLTTGLKIAEDIKDTFGAAIFYTRMGLAYFRLANLPEALKADLASLALREKIKDSAGMCSSLINIGNVYSEQNNYTEALKYEERALKLCIRFKQRNNASACYNNMGGIEVKSKRFDSALYNFNKSIEIERQIGDSAGVAIALGNIGEIYTDLGKYDKALEYTTQGLIIKKAVGYRFYESAYIQYSDIYNRMKQYRMAKLYADTALELSMAGGSKDRIELSYQDLARADSGLGDYKAALTNSLHAQSWRDSLVNEENTKKTVQAEMNYEFEKKQAEEKAEQDKKDAIATTEQRKQNIIIASVSLGLILVLVFSGLLLSRFRVTQRQKRIIEEQKSLVEEKNKDITDSIHYASRIQRALLTTDEYISKRLSDYFILFKPRDIVSGDFYWALSAPSTNGTDSFLICAGDCTGHGVPGAFMSLLNISLLNEVTIERKIYEPAKVLDDVREHIIKALNPEGKDEGSKDGMDCILASLTLSEGGAILKYAAAYNAPVVIRNNNVIELQADKMPVGIFPGEKKPFTQHTVELQKGDCIYLFTDGYADQFGGEKGKKFKYKQLQQLIMENSQLTMAEQKQILEKAFENWKGNLAQVDDVLVIGIRI